MKKKNILAITLIFVLLFLSTTGIAASETGRTLKYADRGEDVVKLQQTLNQMGYYNYYIDGIYGKITERAVINFQIDHNIRIDGIAGTQTQSTLYSIPNTISSRGTTTKGTATTKNYDSNDIYWLARIIHAEAQAEPYEGKVAIGNVILNRVNSSAFPNTIYNVIFEYYGNIPQFSPVADGTIYNTPSPESIQAAKDAINGARPVGNATYFFNPNKAAGSWIVKNKAYVTRIGRHVFYQ